MKNQLVICIFLLISFIGKTQTKEVPVCTKGLNVTTVSGVITDENNEPLPGIAVTVVRTKTEIHTDIDGEFSIGTKKGDVIVCSYLGYKTMEVVINDSSDVNIKMEEDESALSEVVYFGCFFNHVEENAFKIYEVKNTNFNTQQDVYNAITAKVPGIRITNTNLGETPNIPMRGDDCTIVIVDGVRYNASILNTINPSDIEKIEVSNNVAASNYLRTKINQ